MAVNLDTTQLVALAAALGWASGLRLYAVVICADKNPGLDSLCQWGAVSARRRPAPEPC